MKNLSILRPANIIATPDYVDHVLLTTSPQAIDNVSGAAYLGFAATVDFYVKYGSTGVLYPTSNTTGGGSGELNPTMRYVGSTVETTGYSVVAPSTGVLTVSYWKAGG